MRLYKIVDKDILLTYEKKEFRDMAFNLILFHTIILERRKYGPIGWNTSYQWMESDLDISLKHLDVIYPIISIFTNLRFMKKIKRKTNKFLSKLCAPLLVLSTMVAVSRMLWMID